MLLRSPREGEVETSSIFLIMQSEAVQNDKIQVAFDEAVIQFPWRIAEIIKTERVEILLNYFKSAIEGIIHMEVDEYIERCRIRIQKELF